MRVPPTVLLAGLALACTGPGGADTAATAADPTAADTDEALLRAAIAGEADPAEALAAVERGGGLPVRTTSGTFLFACLCGDGDWMLAGDHDGWTGSPMERAGELWWIEVPIEDPDGSLYKFTDGTDWIADPLARRYGYDEFGEYSLVRASAAHLERWHDVTGEGAAADLRPRDLEVWVPEDGAFTHVLYAQDGNNLFDPEAPWGGWRLDESLPGGMLVVGIDNTVDRDAEYTHTTDVIDGETLGGDGAAYAALVEETIRPMMEAAYGEGDATGLMGSSLGGLISFYAAHLYEDRYAMAISLSGTMGWGSIGADNPTMLDLYAEAGHRSTALYLDSGGDGTCWDADGDGLEDDDPDATDNYCENRQFADLLADIGYTWEVDLWHWHEPGATHDEAAWAERVWRPLEIFAGL